MLNQLLHTKVQLYLCCAFAFFLSFKFALPIFVVLMVLNSLLEGNFKARYTNIPNKKWVLLFCSLYLLYLVGMVYSENKSYGWADLQTKLSMLLFPLFLNFSQFEQQETKKIQQFFLAGVVIASVSLLGRATFYYLYEHLNYFYYVDFSVFLHPSYFGMMINLALIFILLDASKSGISSSFVRITLLLFFSLIILLLSSKLALISCLLIFIGVGIYRILHSKNYLTGIVFLLLFVAAATSIIYTVPELNQRIQNARVVLNANSIDKTDAESNAVRILVWQAATAAFLENGIVGTGTGDVKDELFKHYKRNGYTGALEHRLNAHNQFLQTGVALGYFGFVLFLLSIIVPASIALKNKNYVYVSFVLLVVLNFLTESMLESEAGVFIYAFFNSLLFFRKI